MKISHAYIKVESQGCKTNRNHKETKIRNTWEILKSVGMYLLMALSIAQKNE